MWKLLLLAIALLSPCAALAQAQKPESDLGFLQPVLDFFRPVERADREDAAQAIEQLVASTAVWVDRVGDRVTEEGTAIAKILYFTILVAEIVFCGIRIMMRASILEQLTRLTITSSIFLLVFLQVPQNIILSAQEGLADGGRSLGSEIVKIATSREVNAELGLLGDGAIEPSTYWFAWLGNRSSGPYLFQPRQIMLRIWGRDIQDIQARGTEEDKKRLADHLGNTTMSGFLSVLFPAQVVAAVLPICITETSSVCAILFSNISLVIAANAVLHLAVGLGLAVMPLMYFKSFERSQIWSGYLVGLVGMVLVQPLFYIFSAFGFLFATTTFDTLFPREGGSAVKFLGDLFLQSGTDALKSLSFGIHLVWDATAKLSTAVIGNLFLVGFLGGGALIIATFIQGGLAFSVLAVSAAFRWNRGFASEEMFSRITDFFTGVTGAVGSAAGSGIGEAVQRTAGFATGTFSGGGRRMP